MSVRAFAISARAYSGFGDADGRDAPEIARASNPH
jgi:hypothetical protein